MNGVRPMTLAAQVAGIVSAALALFVFVQRAVRWYVHPRHDKRRRYEKAIRTEMKAHRVEIDRLERVRQLDSRNLRKALDRRSRERREILRAMRGRSVSPRLPVWALILFEPDEAERWAREVESHIWELLSSHAVKQARRDRRKLIVRGLLLAIVLRATKRFSRAKRRS